ncbi:hypothetical protein QNH36_22435 [Mesobacillus sp. AQ2]|uniref:hypothetical protein n=1 Tax=Bacillaceae TaxID=186817 RepID=UPI0011A6A508|nr:MULTISPECIES: hypothetical protein [Bacillaceae]WHX40365.1 hypothetical protein QNH36_22435 [Mesobacillus sp. AQ2]
MKNLLVVLLFSLSILQGCNNMDENKQEEILEKAIHAANEEFKKQMGWEIVVDDHEFTTRTEGTELFLYGYKKGDKQNKITATVDYSEEYKVQSIGYTEK